MSTETTAAKEPATGTSLWARFKTLWGTTWYATATTLVAAIAGLLGSVYTDDIRNGISILTTTGAFPGWNARAMVFWIALTLSAVMFFWRQRHDDETRFRLAAGTARIEELVQTLPPTTFRGVFREVTSLTHTLLEGQTPRTAPTAAQREILMAQVKAILGSFLKLAQEFDGHPAAAYAVNIMAFVPSGAPAALFPDSAWGALRFAADDVDKASMAGLLLLRADLAIKSTKDGKEEPDPIVPFALPVPKKSSVGTKSTLLPGAPRAFGLQRSADGYADTATLGNWCRDNVDAKPSVIEALETYFSEHGEGNQVKSFVSFSLFHGGSPFAVVNLHSESAGVVGISRREKFDVFEAMTLPLRLELGTMLHMLLTAERNL